MTCREKLKLEHPDMIDHKKAGGAVGCPQNYGYMGSDFTLCALGRCEECWDREIPGTNNAVKEAALRMAERLKAAGSISEESKEDAMAKPTNIEVSIIKDSGNRREFESGAVRDMQEGKGRCDLMPLEVVAYMLSEIYSPSKPENRSPVINSIRMFMSSGETQHLYSAIMHFREQAFEGSNETMLLEVAKHFEEGAKKYEEDNWKKGIPPKCYIDSAVRHYLKWLRGDKDEPHDRAFVWNLMCCIWEVDYREKEETSNEVC